MKKRETIIISLGGSLIVPEEIDWKFIKTFKKVIEKKIKEGYKFIIITGGGKLARKYQEASLKISKLTDDDRDWIGIHATRMNAHFIRTIFRKNAHPRINKNPNDLEEFLPPHQLKKLKSSAKNKNRIGIGVGVNFKEDILVAAGWRPGFSTDYDAVLLAKYFKIRKVINLSNIDFVYNKDPKKFPDAQKITGISWTDFRKMVGNKWDPGMNVPFDPVASRTAEEINLEVAIMNGRSLKNLENYIEGKKFKGTVIK